MQEQKKCMGYPCKENAVYERHGRYYCEKHAITIPFNHKCAKCGKEINVFVDVAYDEDYDLLCSKECYLKYFGYDPIWYECDDDEAGIDESLEVRQ